VLANQLLLEKDLGFCGGSIETQKETLAGLQSNGLDRAVKLGHSVKVPVQLVFNR
jgi:hypothetical protein